MMEKNRCTWADTDPLLQKYHDEEWGRPVHDDRKHYMYLLMEAMSCGLSWLLMLKKQEVFRKCFADFDYNKVATFRDDEACRIAAEEGMIHSERKVKAMIANARAFCKVCEEFGTFDKYIWSFTNNETIYELDKVSSELSDSISKDLKQRGMTFVGKIIIYSYLQAIGIINSHEPKCFKHHKI